MIDHMIVFGEAHLRRIQAFCDIFNSLN